MKALDQLFKLREQRGLPLQPREAHMRDFRRLLLKMVAVQICASLLVLHFSPDLIYLWQQPLFQIEGVPDTRYISVTTARIQP
jgi:hypothetical protein